MSKLGNIATKVKNTRTTTMTTHRNKSVKRSKVYDTYAVPYNPYFFYSNTFTYPYFYQSSLIPSTYGTKPRKTKSKPKTTSISKNSSSTTISQSSTSKKDKTIDAKSNTNSASATVPLSVLSKTTTKTSSQISNTNPPSSTLTSSPLVSKISTSTTSTPIINKSSSSSTLTSKSNNNKYTSTNTINNSSLINNYTTLNNNTTTPLINKCPTSNTVTSSSLINKYSKSDITTSAPHISKYSKLSTVNSSPIIDKYSKSSSITSSTAINKYSSSSTVNSSPVINKYSTSSIVKSSPIINKYSKSSSIASSSAINKYSSSSTVNSSPVIKKYSTSSSVTSSPHISKNVTSSIATNTSSVPSRPLLTSTSSINSYGLEQQQIGHRITEKDNNNILNKLIFNKDHTSSVHGNESLIYIKSTSNSNSGNYINKTNIDNKNSPLDSKNSNKSPSYTNNYSLAKTNTKSSSLSSSNSNFPSLEKDNKNYSISNYPLERDDENYSNSDYSLGKDNKNYSNSNYPLERDDKNISYSNYLPLSSSSALSKSSSYSSKLLNNQTGSSSVHYPFSKSIIKSSSVNKSSSSSKGSYKAFVPATTDEYSSISSPSQTGSTQSDSYDYRQNSSQEFIEDSKSFPTPPTTPLSKWVSNTTAHSVYSSNVDSFSCNKKRMSSAFTSGVLTNQNKSLPLASNRLMNYSSDTTKSSISISTPTTLSGKYPNKYISTSYSNIYNDDGNDGKRNIPKTTSITTSPRSKILQSNNDQYKTLNPLNNNNKKRKSPISDTSKSTSIIPNLYDEYSNVKINNNISTAKSNSYPTCNDSFQYKSSNIGILKDNDVDINKKFEKSYSYPVSNGESNDLLISSYNKVLSNTKIKAKTNKYKRQKTYTTNNQLLSESTDMKWLKEQEEKLYAEHVSRMNAIIQEEMANEIRKEMLHYGFDEDTDIDLFSKEPISVPSITNTTTNSTSITTVSPITKSNLVKTTSTDYIYPSNKSSISLISTPKPIQKPVSKSVSKPLSSTIPISNSVTSFGSVTKHMKETPNSINSIVSSNHSLYSSHPNKSEHSSQPIKKEYSSQSFKKEYISQPVKKEYSSRFVHKDNPSFSQSIPEPLTQQKTTIRKEKEYTSNYTSLSSCDAPQNIIPSTLNENNYLNPQHRQKEPSQSYQSQIQPLPTPSLPNSTTVNRMNNYTMSTLSQIQHKNEPMNLNMVSNKTSTNINSLNSNINISNTNSSITKISSPVPSCINTLSRSVSSQIIKENSKPMPIPSRKVKNEENAEEMQDAAEILLQMHLCV
ncbi:hypothetical protein H8356DRAFT_965096 [Neocallimastix lanati (nom. inval.)]|uniref:Uncharacterized protein n=1 Tax=Neocallimastix californiae TaxID=1754190 RepID=A0A1Y2ATY1_9FUNG|nr:hypothetical protein H8356DRAFT_965096 [Neocallimastix sp. JGI-2020a]ORY25687.1 hypothetical protein LY90DRAFT_674786 [Neocallimastix californiae]|eukprot:ORY25687.1 hypothetical protein LY90DRAFT_674786 [Neocallimastix californiae]